MSDGPPAVQGVPIQPKWTTPHPQQSVTSEVIAAAIEVHRALGPGLLESAYQAAMCRESSLRGVAFVQQVDMPLSYKGVNVDCGYRLDLIVDNRVVVELKAGQEIMPVHEAQLLTYLRLTGMRVGVLINFNVAALKKGIRRQVL